MLDEKPLCDAQTLNIIRYHLTSETIIQRMGEVVMAKVDWGPARGQYGEIMQRRERQEKARQIARDMLNVLSDSLLGLDEI